MPASPSVPLFPYTTLFRSGHRGLRLLEVVLRGLARLQGDLDRVVEDGRAGLEERVGERLSVLLPLLRLEARRDTRFRDRKSTRLNSSHRCISYAVFCLKKK